MLQTRSSFYYGFVIPPTAIFFSFQELTGPVRIAQLSAKAYSLSGAAVELQRALRAAGTQDYVVTVDRNTRQLSISAPLAFDILIDSGPFGGSQIWSILGLGDTDLTGLTSYAGADPIGKEYLPQIFLLDYVPSSSSKRAIDATVNETGTGQVEVVNFGKKSITKFVIDFINDNKQDDSSYLEQNLSGVSDAVDFMNSITEKTPIEFMPDRDSKDIFEELLLESTPEDSRGLGFELKEKAGLPNYFTTGLLQFRKVEA